MHSMNNFEKERLKTTPDAGFTLVELMVVVAIIGIASVVIIPSVMYTMPNMRLRAAAMDLHSALMQAKGLAVKRNVNHALTFNQQVGGVAFSYIGYEDTDNDCEYDAGETIFVRLEQWPKDVKLDQTQGGGDGLTFVDNDDGNPTIAFRPTALPIANAGAVGNGTAFLINTMGAERSVAVRLAGVIFIE